MAAVATPSEQTGQALVCYRHPNVETGVACSSCGRPICTDCMVFAAVGIKCPECAGQPSGVRRATTRAGSRATSRGGAAIVTKTIIAANVLVFLVQLGQAGGGVRETTGEVFVRFSIFGPAVADGEWWRLITGAFLHAGPIHILFNMLMLWWFGQALEVLLGPVRYLGIYFASALAGSAGALLVAPDVPTVGASGAVFGILGAGLVLERRNVMVFGGSAFAIVAFNLVFTFLLANISIGGHLGGLVGGILAILALTGFGRRHAVYGRVDALTVLSLLAVAAGSVLVAYLSVRGYA
jgi:membrane associated rhomboid family serine protease